MTFGTKLTKAQLQERVLNNWACWQLLMANRGFTFREVFGKPFMTPQDVEEANLALKYQLEAEKRALNKKK